MASTSRRTRSGALIRRKGKGNDAVVKGVHVHREEETEESRKVAVVVCIAGGGGGAARGRGRGRSARRLRRPRLALVARARAIVTAGTVDGSATQSSRGASLACSPFSISSSTFRPSLYY